MKPVIKQRDGKRIYDFTKDTETVSARDDDTINMAIAVVPDQLAPDRLMWARDLLQRAIQTLDLQVAAIRQRLLEENERPENARWWAKATAAERIKAKQRVRLQTAFGDVNRLIRAQRKIQTDLEEKARRKTKDRRFIELVREHLSEETYLAIWERVNAEFAVSVDQEPSQ